MVHPTGTATSARPTMTFFALVPVHIWIACTNGTDNYCYTLYIDYQQPIALALPPLPFPLPTIFSLTSTSCLLVLPIQWRTQGSSLGSDEPHSRISSL